jgi:hypothetical protein
VVDIYEHVRIAHLAVQRAQRVSRGLDQSSRTSDVLQVAAGIAVELNAIERNLYQALLALQGLAPAATGDRPGKERTDARETSRATASSITLKTGNQRTKILLSLFNAPMTDYELQHGLAIGASTERPRRGELVDCGLATPTTAVRKHEGTEWTVWDLTVAGRVAAGQVMAGATLRLTRDISDCAGEQVSEVDTETVSDTLF